MIAIALPNLGKLTLLNEQCALVGDECSGLELLYLSYLLYLNKY